MKPSLHFQISWKKAKVVSAIKLCVKPKFYVSRAKIHNSSEQQTLFLWGLFLTPLVTYIELH